MKAAGGNYIRNTMSDRPDRGFRGVRLPPTRQRQVRPESMERRVLGAVSQMLQWTSERDIIVQIEVWDRFDYTDSKEQQRWQLHPYNPVNNVNYTYRRIWVRHGTIRTIRAEQAAVLLHNAQATEQHSRAEVPAAIRRQDAVLLAASTTTCSTAWTTKRRARKHGEPTGPEYITQSSQGGGQTGERDGDVG